MQDTNTVTIIGRLTRDVELKYTSGGLAIASLSIASNRRAKQGEEWVDEASFFDVTYMGRGAEAVQQYLTKGKQVCISGSLKQERWEKDGQKRSKVVIHANNVQLLGGRDGGSRSGSADDFESDVPF